MARNSRAAVKFTRAPPVIKRASPQADRLNHQVLQTIHDLASVKLETDPGVEDEYEFEIFGNTGPTPKKKT